MEPRDWWLPLLELDASECGGFGEGESHGILMTDK